jgi:hypothetical protein
MVLGYTLKVVPKERRRFVCKNGKILRGQGKKKGTSEY